MTKKKKNVKVVYKTSNKICFPKKVRNYRSFGIDETSLIEAKLSVYPHACKVLRVSVSEGIQKGYEIMWAL
jgi:hypothetical protein